MFLVLLRHFILYNQRLLLILIPIKKIVLSTTFMLLASFIFSQDLPENPEPEKILCSL